MTQCDPRWQGQIEQRVMTLEAGRGELSALRDELRDLRDEILREFRNHRDSTTSKLHSMELKIAQGKAFLQGSKATLVLIGTVLGAAISALVSWFLGRH